MNLRREVIEELLRENVKGLITNEVQVEHLNNQLDKLGDENSELKMSVNRNISERLSTIDIYKAHSLILRKKLKEEKVK